jgi:uncharacterized RDD family membrane protein YckC
MPFEDDLIEVITPERVGLNFPVAGPGSRFGAAILDVFFILIINIAILLSFLNLIQSFTTQENSRYIISLVTGLMIILFFLLEFGYHIFFEYKRNGQTPGKRIMRIRTIRVDGLPLDFNSVLIRNLMRPVDIILCAIAIGFLLMFLSKLSQRAGDYVAGTVVIHDRIVTLEHLRKYLKGPAKETRLGGFEGRFRGLNDEEAELIEHFMVRRGEMNLDSRRELAEKIAKNIRSKTGIGLLEYGGNENLIRITHEALLKREKGNW